KIVVAIKPYSWIEVPLVIGSYQRQFVEGWREGKLKVGEITLLNNRAIVTFKKEVEEKKPSGYASVDINLMSLDILEAKDELKYRKIDLKKLYGVRVHYFEKRRKIQALSKFKPKTSKMLMEKYSKREKRRVNDILHKVTAAIVREFIENGVSPILEKLKGLSYNATRNKYAKRKNRKVSSLPYRKIQRFIEYKMAWHGYKTHHVSARNTSKTCPRCGRLSKTNGQVFKCESCGFEADRHFVACINILRMWGIGFPPKALNELIEREELSRNKSNNSPCIPT
ncbi:MAG: transposase, partial [Candidatus Bathyarchaeia archaeon]